MTGVGAGVEAGGATDAGSPSNAAGDGVRADAGAAPVPPPITGMPVEEAAGDPPFSASIRAFTR